MQARVIQVIETASKVGKGVDGDPVRLLVEYWSIDGNLLAVKDTWPPPLQMVPEEDHSDE